MMIMVMMMMTTTTTTTIATGIYLFKSKVATYRYFSTLYYKVSNLMN